MKRFFVLLNCTLLLSILVFPEISRAQASGYKSPEQVLSWIKEVGEKHPDIFTSSNIASSPGGRPLYLIRIGENPESNIEAKPSIFVAQSSARRLGDS